MNPTGTNWHSLWSAYTVFLIKLSWDVSHPTKLRNLLKWVTYPQVFLLRSSCGSLLGQNQHRPASFIWHDPSQSASHWRTRLQSLQSKNILCQIKLISLSFSQKTTFSCFLFPFLSPSLFPFVSCLFQSISLQGKGFHIIYWHLGCLWCLSSC